MSSGIRCRSYPWGARHRPGGGMIKMAQPTHHEALERLGIFTGEWTLEASFPGDAPAAPSVLAIIADRHAVLRATVFSVLIVSIIAFAYACERSEDTPRAVYLQPAGRHIDWQQVNGLPRDFRLLVVLVVVVLQVGRHVRVLRAALL